MNEEARRQIDSIVLQIVERFRPQRVVLFGSYATGDITADSDVDLLVVMDAEEKPLRAAARIAASVDHPLPLDILVMRPDDVAAALSRQAMFVSEVMDRGIVLYEA